MMCGKLLLVLGLAVAAFGLTGAESEPTNADQVVEKVALKVKGKVDESIHTLTEVFGSAGKVNTREMRKRGWGSFFGALGGVAAGVLLGKRDVEDGPTIVRDVSRSVPTKRGWGSFFGGLAGGLILGKRETGEDGLDKRWGLFGKKRHSEAAFTKLLKRDKEPVPKDDSATDGVDPADDEVTFKEEVAKVKGALDVLNGVIAVADFQA